MPKDQAYIKTLSVDLMEANANRNRMLRAMDDFYQSRWQMPAPLNNMKWIHKVVTTDPHDAVRAGTRVLSALDPAIRLQPLMNDEANKIKANEWEQQLKWYFVNASLRRRATVLSDMVMSALLYDMVAVQVMYLPYQAREEKSIQRDSMDYRSRERFGPFVLTVHNPQNVYPLDSTVGLEGALSVRTMRIHEVAAEWGNKASMLLMAAAGDSAENQMNWVTVYDYWDNEMRYVWGVPGQERVEHAPHAAAGIDILPPTRHDMGWMPWVIRQGGTNLFSSSEHRLNPMLYSVYESGQWDTQNIAETLAVSEVISYAAAPRGKVSGPSYEGVERKFGEPGNLVWEMPGHSYTSEPAPQIDAGLFTIVDRISSRIDKSTVARILQNADIAPNTAFSTLNLATQTALGALKPYKHLAEVSVADILTTMLLWIKQMNEPAYAYGFSGEYSGRQMRIDPAEIEPSAIYIDVELKPDVPTDRLQRINAGRILQSMGVSKRRSIEETGITDPEQAIQEGYYDQLLENMMQIEMRRTQHAAELEMQLQSQQAMMGLQQQMQQAQQEQQGQQMQAGPQGPQGPPPTGPFGELNGPGFAPPEGGLPFAQGAPEATREQLNGQTRTGEEF